MTGNKNIHKILLCASPWKEVAATFNEMDREGFVAFLELVAPKVVSLSLQTGYEVIFGAIGL